MEPKPLRRDQLQTMRLIVNEQLELASRLKRIRKGSLPELELVTFWLNDVRRISERESPSAQMCVYAKSTLYRCIGRLSRIQSEAPPSLSRRFREQFSRLTESWRALQSALRPSRALTLWRAYR
ncbi:MAG TPA: hypothetical protein VFY29_04125 [Terriglobia bacterium]|nr:hypothetical protein [Terriglobia bacterium]